MSYLFQHTITPRPNTNDSLLIQVLDGLLRTYMERVPDAKRVAKLIIARGDSILNDHIAFRSIDIRSILTIFLHLGYAVQMDATTNKPFNFEQKKLTAVWLKHPNPQAPRVFVSQFRFADGSQALQDIVSKYIGVWEDPIHTLDLNNPDDIHTYLHTAQWPTPTYADYTALQQESEYVAWVLYNKYYLNHFTLTVHALKSFGFASELVSTLQAYKESYAKQAAPTVVADAIAMMHRKYERHFNVFNDWLVEQGFSMNMPHGKVANIAPDRCLLQSSTKAALIDAPFKEGVHQIPGSYVEFAYRGLLDAVTADFITQPSPITEGDIHKAARRDGFETQNANAIFESTYVGAEQASDTLPKKSTYIESCLVIDDFLN
jgi:hypothetical protein